MQTQSFKLSTQVIKREEFLQQEFRKTLSAGNYGVNAAKKQRLLKLINDLHKRYGCHVVTFCTSNSGLTKDNISGNGKYSLD